MERCISLRNCKKYSKTALHQTALLGQTPRGKLLCRPNLSMLATPRSTVGLTYTTWKGEQELQHSAISRSCNVFCDLRRSGRDPHLGLIIITPPNNHLVFLFLNRVYLISTALKTSGEKMENEKSEVNGAWVKSAPFSKTLALSLSCQGLDNEIMDRIEGKPGRKHVCDTNTRV